MRLTPRVKETRMNLLPAILAILALAAATASAAPVVTPHAATELVAATRGVSPGGTLQVAVVQHLDKGWHSYWRNPGDAGEATTVRWTLPTGWQAGEIIWPTPKRLPVGPIMNYGYEGEVILPITLRAPTGLRPGDRVTLSAAVDFLVCAEVCIPGSARVALPVVVGPTGPDPDWAGPIAHALAAAPKDVGLQAVFETQAGAVRLAVTGDAVAGAAATDAYFYPYSDKLIDHAKPQAVERGAQGLTLTLVTGEAFAGGARPARITGVLALDGAAYGIDAAPGPLPAGAAGLGAPRKPVSRAGLGLAAAATFAFIGGLILNLMPCVFPILSIKAAALARHGGDRRSARTSALAFLAGVLATFLILAGMLIAARAAGEAVGWGFQLQSPLIVALLGLVMLAAALNLSGLYEIGASAQGLGAGLASRPDRLGSAFTGVLAVVVAAPCTAPFMGPALGFALTQDAATALAVFLALGLGFAAPFTLLAFTPALMSRLPRPGAWMDTFKHALAFPMYAAAAWLLWVLAQQTGPEGLARMLAAAVALGLAAWLFGAAQKRQALGGSGLGGSIAAALVLIAGLATAVVGGYPPPTASGASAEAGHLVARPWSPAAVSTLRAQGIPVLVNFTAAWCVTCQVNERVAFSSGAVAAALKRTGAVYLVADWTNHDGAIAKALTDHGRIGVPLYLVYGAQGDQPKVLPQLLTPGLIVRALDDAAQGRIAEAG